MTEGSIGRIFISYRRQETAWPARQLYEVLVARFGAASVFKDVDDIEPGDDFVDRITDAVAACDVLLALIGPQWLTMTDDKGRRRLDNPEDFVRLEVKAALSRNVRVVPILVDGARMPPAEELPDDLAAITRRQAVEINPVGFNTERLLATLAGKPQAKRFGGPTTGGAAEDTDVRLGEAREPSDSGPPVASPGGSASSEAGTWAVASQDPSPSPAVSVASPGGSASSEAGTWVVASQDPSPSPAVSVVPAEPMPPSEPMPPVGLPPPVGLAPSPGPAPSFPGPELSVPLAPSRGSASSAWSSSSPGSSPGSTSVPGAGSSQGSGSVPGSASSPRSGSSEESTSVPGSGYSEGYFPGSGYSEGYSAGSGYPSGSGSSQESASSPRSASSVGMVSSTSPAGTPWPGTAQASPVPQAPVPPLTSAEPPTSSGGAGAPVPPLAASEGPTTSDPSQVAPPASWESSLPPLGPPELSWEPPVPPLTPRQPPTRPGRNLILAGAAAVVVGLVGVLLLWRPWAPVTSVSVATPLPPATSQPATAPPTSAAPPSASTLPSAEVSPTATPPSADLPSPPILAHRGGLEEHQFETQQAMEAAARAGFAVETDVRFTSDGVAVLVHDERATKGLDCGGQEIRVSDTTWSQLRKACRSKPTAKDPKTYQVPTLDATLEAIAAASPTAWVFLEVKTDQTAAQRRAFLAAPAKYGLADRTVVTSFERSWLRAIRDADSSRRRMLFVSQQQVPASQLKSDRLWAVAVEQGIATPEYLKQLRGIGVKVMVWVVNDPTAWAKVTKLAPDLLMTAYPAKYQAWLAGR